MSELKGDELREEVFHVIKKKWPVHVSEAARELDMFPKSGEDKATISRLKYHFDQLAREDRIKVKKIDRALVAWPAEVEKYRTIHEMLE
jgi:predicted transcriptional regulator